MCCCVFALVSLCTAEDGPFVVTPADVCDTVKEKLVLNNGVETKSTEKTHGKFSVLVEDEGTGIVRPDIYGSNGLYAYFYASKNGRCTGNNRTFKSAFVFEHREEATYNGHKCFRYFNNSDASMFVDNGNITWGIRYVEDSDYIWVNYSYPTTPHTPDMFMFTEGTACKDEPRTASAPEDTFFYGMCMNDGASHLLGSLFLTVFVILAFLF